MYLRSNYNSDGCNKSNGLSHDVLRPVSSAQITILHRTSSGRQLKSKKETDQDRILTYSRVNGTLTLREKYPNTELFLLRIFMYSE